MKEKITKKKTGYNILQKTIVKAIHSKMSLSSNLTIEAIWGLLT